LGFAAIALEKYAEARKYLEEAVKVEPESRSTDRGMGLAWLSLAECGQGQTNQAISTIVQALKIGAVKRLFPVLFIALPVSALLLTDLGEMEWALEILALSLNFSYVANSNWHKVVIEKVISSRAGGLAQAQIASARARGQARDLITTVEELLALFENRLSA
jgi:tetratricopeptide (TPR) repeat protein